MPTLNTNVKDSIKEQKIIESKIKEIKQYEDCKWLTGC